MAETSPFFKLPAELRNEIYRYLLGGWHEVRAPTVRKGAFDIKSVHLNIEALDLATPKVLENSPNDTDDSKAAKDDEAPRGSQGRLAIHLPAPASLPTDVRRSLSHPVRREHLQFQTLHLAPRGSIGSLPLALSGKAVSGACDTLGSRSLRM